MGRVQRDTFDVSPDQWLAARAALLELFTAAEADRDASGNNTQFDAVPDSALDPDAPVLVGQGVSEPLADAMREALGDEAAERLALCSLPQDFRLSVVVPVFNEATTIEQVLRRLMNFPLPLEVIVVDDGSRDGSRDLLKSLIPQWSQDLPSDKSIELILHAGNQGKGAALKTGFAAVSGTIVAIQDADLEYDPLDFVWLLGPLLTDRADVVYGSRFGRGSQADSPFWHRWGNQLITWCSDLTTGLWWSDVETCYKLVRTEVIREVGPTLRERGFGIELELTAKLARYPGLRFYERPIRYQKRGYAEGKKIGIKDALWAAWCIARYRLAD